MGDTKHESEISSISASTI